jgi:hypothetical protein
MHWWVMESPRNTMVSPSCGVKLSAVFGACDRAGSAENNRVQNAMIDFGGFMCLAKWLAKGCLNCGRVPLVFDRWIALAGDWVLRNF